MSKVLGVARQVVGAFFGTLHLETLYSHSCNSELGGSVVKEVHLAVWWN